MMMMMVVVFGVVWWGDISCWFLLWVALLSKLKGARLCRMPKQGV